MKVLSIGKKEGAVGLITYMRTDSTRISDTAKTEAIRYIEGKYGKEYVVAEVKTSEKAKRMHKMPMKRFVQRVQCVHQMS